MLLKLIQNMAKAELHSYTATQLHLDGKKIEFTKVDVIPEK
jgi:hypothetical protein